MKQFLLSALILIPIGLILLAGLLLPLVMIQPRRPYSMWRLA